LIFDLVGQLVLIGQLAYAERLRLYFNGIISGTYVPMNFFKSLGSGNAYRAAAAANGSGSGSITS
jgi:hypothetical protein